MTGMRRSLRARLLWLLLPPLIVVAAATALWRYHLARQTAEELYDKTLLAVTLAVARDVSASGGDLLAEGKLELLTENLGDQIFYRVDAEGVVTGYVDAPRPPARFEAEPGKVAFYNSVYHGRPVRAAVYREFVAEGDLIGWSRVLVWQTTRERAALAQRLARQAVVWMLAILAVAAGLVWFGVERGLRPLLDLGQAVALRSPTDLSPIRRQVPREVKGIVAAMNALFGQLRDAFAARDALIANAAHQLRNPVAAIRAQAEAAEAARDLAEMQARVRGVAEASRRASRLIQQLLSLERVHGQGLSARERFDLSGLVAEVTRARAPEIIARGANIDFDAPSDGVWIDGDRTMIGEAVENLIDNAIRYGTRERGHVAVSTRIEQDRATLVVEDDGPGVPADRREAVFDRFTRLCEDSSDGCGLGLAIVRDVADAHGGEAVMDAAAGARFILRLPIAQQQGAGNTAMQGHHVDSSN